MEKGVEEAMEEERIIHYMNEQIKLAEEEAETQKSFLEGFLIRYPCYRWDDVQNCGKVFLIYLTKAEPKQLSCTKILDIWLETWSKVFLRKKHRQREIFNF